MTTPDELKSALAGVHRQAARAEKADDNIAHAAGERLQQVNDRLSELRGEALTDQAASEEYQALMVERGQLQTVLAQG